MSRESKASVDKDFASFSRCHLLRPSQNLALGDMQGPSRNTTESSQTLAGDVHHRSIDRNSKMMSFRLCLHWGGSAASFWCIDIIARMDNYDHPKKTTWNFNHTNAKY